MYLWWDLLDICTEEKIIYRGDNDQFGVAKVMQYIPWEDERDWDPNHEEKGFLH